MFSVNFFYKMTSSLESAAKLYRNVAQAAKENFFNISVVDAVVTLNSCPRRQAVAQVDHDMAILVSTATSDNEMTQCIEHGAIILRFQKKITDE